jgi:hypothetical protein
MHLASRSISHCPPVPTVPAVGIVHAQTTALAVSERRSVTMADAYVFREFNTQGTELDGGDTFAAFTQLSQVCAGRVGVAPLTPPHGPGDEKRATLILITRVHPIQSPLAWMRAVGFMIRAMPPPGGDASARVVARGTNRACVRSAEATSRDGGRRTPRRRRRRTLAWAAGGR